MLGSGRVRPMTAKRRAGRHRNAGTGATAGAGCSRLRAEALIGVVVACALVAAGGLTASRFIGSGGGTGARPPPHDGVSAPAPPRAPAPARRPPAARPPGRWQVAASPHVAVMPASASRAARAPPRVGVARRVGGIGRRPAVPRHRRARRRQGTQRHRRAPRPSGSPGLDRSGDHRVRHAARTLRSRPRPSTACGTSALTSSTTTCGASAATASRRPCTPALRQLVRHRRHEQRQRRRRREDLPELPAGLQRPDQLAELGHQHVRRDEPGTGIYEDAYDIWLNGLATSGSTEVMIWTQNNGQTPVRFRPGHRHVRRAVVHGVEDRQLHRVRRQLELHLGDDEPARVLPVDHRQGLDTRQLHAQPGVLRRRSSCRPTASRPPSPSATTRSTPAEAGAARPAPPATFAHHLFSTYGESGADRRGVARAAIAGRVRGAAQGRHRAGVHRRVHRHRDDRRLQVPRVRGGAVQVRHEVPLGLRLAVVLPAGRGRRGHADRGPVVRHGPDRGAVRARATPTWGTSSPARGSARRPTNAGASTRSR